MAEVLRDVEVDGQEEGQGLDANRPHGHHLHCFSPLAWPKSRIPRNVHWVRHDGDHL